MVDWRAFLTTGCQLRYPANAMGYSEAKPIAELFEYPTKPVGFLKMSALYDDGILLDDTLARRRLGLHKGTQSYRWGWVPAESALTMWPFGISSPYAAGSIDKWRRVSFTRNARHFVVAQEIDTSLPSWRSDRFTRFDITWWVFRHNGSGRLVDTSALVKHHGKNVKIYGIASSPDVANGLLGRKRLHAHAIYVNDRRAYHKDLQDVHVEIIPWPSLT